MHSFPIVLLTDWGVTRDLLSSILLLYTINPITFYVSFCLCDRPISQIPWCIKQISHNPFCIRSLINTRAHFRYKMVHCGIWDWWIVGFVQHVDSFLVRWCDSFTDVSSALLHWYSAIVWLLYKQTRRVWVKLFSAWTKPTTANRQLLRDSWKTLHT